MDTLAIVSKILLEPAELSDRLLYQALQKNLTCGVDSSDIYLEYTQSESWVLEEGIVKRGIFNIDQGFGIRVISGEKVGFAYADDLNISAINNAAKCARQVIAQGHNVGSVAVKSITKPELSLYPNINPLTTLSEEQKIDLLKSIDLSARKLDRRVSQVNASISASYKVVLVADSDGTWAFDIRPLVNLHVSVLVDDGSRKELGSCSGGRRSGYEIFIREGLAKQYAQEAVRIACLNLEAIPSPAGMMPVVLGSGWPAVMLHEAVGHGLEADFNRKGYSIYANRIGEQVAACGISIVDQGNIPGRRGSLNVDDEGTKTQATLLIENGILTSYMYDKLNAKLMNTTSTGNGRRSSYSELPIPRMTNTFMLSGEYLPEEIISSVDYGVYAVNFSGGQVDITSGEFVFSTSEAYLIEGGRVTVPIKGVTLIGNGPEVLDKITMVGNDLEMDRGVGVCGKYGQNIAVGIGQPTVKISELTIGGSVV